MDRIKSLPAHGGLSWSGDSSDKIANALKGFSGFHFHSEALSRV
jgi:hypothetical protein